MKHKAKRILVVMLTVMIIFGYLTPLVADEANAATADLDLCDLGCELEHCDGDHCDGGHYDEEICDWGHCDEEICDGVICDGDNCDGDCYSEHCGDCECENGHCDEQCDVISSEEVSSSSSVGRRAKAEAVCNHTWKTMVSKQPGCTTAGVYVTRCTKCGAYAQNGNGYIAPLGHKWKRIVTKQPTCTMPGTYVNKCERCDMSTTGTISALGHALSWKYKTAPTETMPGVEEYSCNRCGYVANVRYIPPLGNGSTSSSVGRTVLVHPACANNKHVWKTYTTKEPTCTTSGTYITKCSVCGAGSPNGNGYISALGHKWNRSAPSCTVDRKCDRCGTVDKPRLGHSYAWRTKVNATCTADGSKERYCTRSGCGYVVERQTIKALGHAWDSGTVTKAATCTATGTKTFKCTRCSATTTETIPVAAHNCEWRVTVQPSCKGSGTEQYTCKVCGTGTAWRSIQYYGDHTWVAATCTKAKTCSVCGTTSGNPLGHAYSWRTTVNPTCTTVGKKEQYCTRPGCTSVVNRQDVGALGHAWDNGTVTKAATCTATGTKTFKCTRSGCTASKTETINALGHSWGAAATCTTAQKCTRSGCTAVNKDALGHAWDNGTVTKAATCTATGTKTFKCTRSGCSNTKTETLATIAHTCEWRVTVQPSCKGSGTEQYTCTVCGTGTSWRSIQYYGDHTWVAATCTKAKTCSVCGATSGDPLGHAYAWRTTVDATCTTTGKRERYCTRTGCGHVVERQDIAALGHNWDDGTITTQPTCTSKGVKTFNCTNPGCSMTKTEVVNELPHNGSWSLKYAPTCAGSGTEVYTCSSCGKETGFRSVQYYGDHTWKLESFVGAVGTSEGYETYRCSVCDATKTEAHNYQWETTAPHDCVPGKQEYKCTKCGHIRDGRSIQAYGDHTWQLKEKDETFCTCTCKVCGIEVTREHFYNKTVVLEASEYIEGKLLCKCVFCGDEYTEVIPRLKKTKITYHWNQAGYADTVESYFSLDDNLLSVAVPSDLVVDESFVLLGWCIRNNADVILTDVNKVQDVVSELGNSAELYAVWEKTSGWTYYCDARGHLQMKKLGSKVNWENGDLVPTKNKTFVSFTYASSIEENVVIETHEDWVHIEAVSGGYWIVIDPCFDAISESDNSAAFRRTEVSLSVAGNTGKREKIIIALAQYRPKGYIDADGNTVTKTQRHNEYVEFVNRQGALTEEKYYNTDGSNIKQAFSSNGQAIFLIHREDPFCVKENNKPSRNINYSNYENVWINFDVSYLSFSHNLSRNDSWEADVDSDGVKETMVGMWMDMDIYATKGEGGINGISYWIFDDNENATIHRIFSNYWQDHERPSAGTTAILTTSNFFGLASDFLGSLSNVYPQLEGVTLPVSFLTGLAGNLADAYANNWSEEELKQAILKTCYDTGIDKGIDKLKTVTGDMVLAAFAECKAAKGYGEHASGIMDAIKDYFNPLASDICGVDGFVKQEGRIGFIDILPATYLETLCHVTINCVEKNENHSWHERGWFYAFGERYDIEWVNNTPVLNSTIR